MTRNNSGLTIKINGKVCSKFHSFHSALQQAVLCYKIIAWSTFYEELCQLLTVYVPEDYSTENLLLSSRH
jgi:hypothetical protein